jgi:hypothetical protein
MLGTLTSPTTSPATRYWHLRTRQDFNRDFFTATFSPQLFHRDFFTATFSPRLFHRNFFTATFSPQLFHSA